MQALDYIKHPWVLRLFGSEVTPIRAFICSVSLVLNVIYLYWPFGPVSSVWEWIILILIFPILVLVASVYGVLLWSCGQMLARATWGQASILFV